MKLGDLTAAHLGKTVTIGGDRDRITGTLVGINHHARVADSRSFVDATPKWEIGRSMTEISILGWGEREYRSTAECTVSGE